MTTIKVQVRDLKSDETLYEECFSFGRDRPDVVRESLIRALVHHHAVSLGLDEAGATLLTDELRYQMGEA